MSKAEQPKKVPAPRLRFKQFEGAGEWEEKKLGNFLTESRLSGSDGAKARKLSTGHLQVEAVLDVKFLNV